MKLTLIFYFALSEKSLFGLSIIWWVIFEKVLYLYHSLFSYTNKNFAILACSKILLTRFFFQYFRRVKKCALRKSWRSEVFLLSIFLVLFFRDRPVFFLTYSFFNSTRVTRYYSTKMYKSFSLKSRNIIFLAKWRHL